MFCSDTLVDTFSTKEEAYDKQNQLFRADYTDPFEIFIVLEAEE